MSHKPLRDLGHKQFQKRLRPLLNAGLKIAKNEIIKNSLLTTREEENHKQSGSIPLRIQSQVQLPQTVFDNNSPNLENNEVINELLLSDENTLCEDNADNNSSKEDIFVINVQDEENDNDEDINSDTTINENNADIPLYNGAQVSIKESMLAILSLSLKHNLTMTCIADVIALIELHCPQEGLKKNSLYKFQKFFNINAQSFKKHFFCSLCKTKKATEEEICNRCPAAPKAYFIEMSIINHLKSMYKRKNFFLSLKKRTQRSVEDNIISDVYDGKLYREWKDNNGFLSNPNNISFNWYTDGVPVFKSTKICAWPIYLTINELPFRERKQRHNTLFLGLWFGVGKPHFNNFIYAFRPTFQEIFKGIVVVLPNESKIIVRGILLTGICDLPAKCESLNFMQFNAKFLLLVAAISILSADRILPTQIDIAEDLLDVFVRRFEELYGIRYCSINVHLLLHLANCVRELGPLWAFTCYEYENINGKILKLIHGTTHIDSQTANRHNQLINLMKYQEEIENVGIKNFCDTEKKQVHIIEKLCHKTYSVGKYKILKNIPEEVLSAFNNCNFDVINAHLQQFFRLLRYDKLYIGEKYGRAIQSYSSAVKYIDDNNIKMGIILYFIKCKLNCDCTTNNCTCRIYNFAIVEEIVSCKSYTAVGSKFTYNTDGFYFECRRTGQFKAIKIENLVKLCVFILFSNEKQYIVSSVNEKEVE